MTQSPHNRGAKTARDRDEQLEAWLRDQWTPHGEDSALCLDAETAAAWADGVLGGAALEHAQLHAATCARCQALLATLVRAADGAVTPAVADAAPAWRRWFTWAVPLTAAATAVVALAVWVRTPQPSEPSISRASSSLPSAKADASSNQDAAPKELSSAANAPASNNSNQPRPQRLEDTDRRVALDKTTGTVVRADALKAESLAETTASPATLSPPAPLAAPAPPQAAGEQQPVSAPAPPPPPAPAPSAAARSAAAPAAESKDAAPAVSLFRTVAPLQEQIRLTTVTAPDRVAQWRFDGRQLQHSTDRGVSWTAVESVDASQIRGGSSPSPTVCWLVGRSGLVFVTTDGSSWNRRPLSTSVDLASVVATDARTAIVTAVDGRQFQTTDGGSNWTVR